MYQNSHTPDPRPPTEPLDPIQVNKAAPLSVPERVLVYSMCWNVVYCYIFHNESLIFRLLNRKKKPLSVQDVASLSNNSM